MTGSNLQFEIMTGAFERILATPLSRAALMIGRALKELTPLVVQAVIIVLVAVPFGFGCTRCTSLVGLLLLGVFGVGHRRAVLRAGHRRPQGRVDLLGGAADAAVPAADPVRDDAAAGDRSAAGCRWRRCSTR